MSTESERIYPYWVGIVIDAIERNKSLTHNELGEAIYDAFAQVILKVENDAADLITRREQEAEARGRKEAEGQIALSVKKFKKLAAAVFAVDFYLNKPYPDDDRWTPYTRFVGPAMEALKAALFKNEDVGELEGIHRVAALTHPTPAEKFDPSQVTLCPGCNQMTHTIMSDTKGDEDYCGKCGKLRSADIPTKTEDEK